MPGESTPSKKPRTALKRPARQKRPDAPVAGNLRLEPIAPLQASPTAKARPKASKPRAKRSLSLARPKGGSRWMAPSEDLKMKWGLRLLAAILLIAALSSGEIAWTGDGIKIGFHLPGKRAAAPKGHGF
jgi:hypothetical protein